MNCKYNNCESCGYSKDCAIFKEYAEYKAQLWGSKPTCNNCGHTDCENYQMQRKSEPCKMWVSHKEQLAKAKEIIEAKSTVKAEVQEVKEE